LQSYLRREETWIVREGAFTVIDLCGVNLSEEDVPIEGTVEEDKLAEFVLLGQEVRLLRAAQLELAAEEPLAGEIGLGHGGEL